MIYTLAYKIYQLLVKTKSTPTMIKGGTIKNARIENNIGFGTTLLDVERLENASVKGNETYLSQRKEVPLIYKAIIDVLVGLTIAFIVYKLGWNTIK